MDISDARISLQKLEQDERLFSAANLEDRGQALEQLEIIQEVARYTGLGADLRDLERRAAKLFDRFSQIDQALFSGMRERIRSGRHDPEAMRLRFGQFSRYRGLRGSEHLHFDGLDRLLDGILRIDPRPQKYKSWRPGLVHYEPAPAGAVLELVDYAGPGPQDVFYDLGSGLGRVPFLFHLITGLPAHGIEIDPRLHERALESTKGLNLPGLSYALEDARRADYSRANLFFMFTPFVGRVQHQVMNLLERRARQGAIKIFTFGPCSEQISRLPWLHSQDSHFNHSFKLSIFESTFH